MVVLFSDGQVGSLMEVMVDFSAWTGTSITAGNTLEVVAAAKHHGNNGAHSICVAWNANANSYKNLGVNYTTICIRIYVRFLSDSQNNGTGTDVIVIETATPVTVAKLQYYNDAGTTKWRLGAYAGGLWNYWLSDAILLNQWYCAEIKVVFSVAAGEAHFYLDGIEKLTEVGLANNYNARIITCGQFVSAGGHASDTELHFDCVVVADAYIGPEVSAPKGSIANLAKLAGII